MRFLLYFSAVLAVCGWGVATPCGPLLPGQHRVASSQWWNWDASAELCAERGCCWDETQPPLLMCRYPTATTVNVTRVMVIQGCHLDIGFVRPAADIVNRWFHQFFPLAYTVGKELHNRNPTGPQLKFTAQSWLISMFVDCLPDWEGVVCPTADALAQFNEAVANDWITWHAFPFNGEPEFGDVAMIEYGIQLTHSLDDRFGKRRKRTMSQRDVPGMTRAIIPILRKHNITSISVGVNGGSTPPNVPYAFRWQDAASNLSVNTFYLQGGYGGIGFFPGVFVPTIVPNSNVAMIVDWRGDNSGPPPTADDVESHFKQLQLEFPNARIETATFDDFADVIASLPANSLPTITKEIGDTWIYGISSDPLKQLQMRRVMKARSRCLAEQRCDLSEPRFSNFSRLLLKGISHTWGSDTKSFITPAAFQRSNWSNVDFERVRNTSGYLAMEDSWRVQRRWPLEDAFKLLADHPLQQDIQATLALATPNKPSTEGFTQLQKNAQGQFPILAAGRFDMRVDGGTGAVDYLFDHRTGISWASSKTMVGEVVYRTYNEEDYNDFLLRYNYVGPLHQLDDLDDFGKVGIDAGGAKQRLVGATVASVWVRANSTEYPFTTVLVESHLPQETVELAGAPAVMWSTYRIADNISLSWQWFAKTPTRLPEALFLRFNAAPKGTWSMMKLGEPVDPADVVVGGSKHMHCVSSGITYTATQQTAHHMTVLSEDICLVVFGETTAFPVPTMKAPDFGLGASFILADNLWNTNYVLYYPFQPSDADIKFEFVITFD